VFTILTFFWKRRLIMSTKSFQARVVLIGLTLLAAGVVTTAQSAAQKVFLHCRTEIIKNEAGQDYVKVLVTNNTTETIPRGKTINFQVNTETRGSFGLNFALAPGQVTSQKVTLTGKASSAPKAWWYK
jgi:hypothetical protein